VQDGVSECAMAKGFAKRFRPGARGLRGDKSLSNDGRGDGWQWGQAVVVVDGAVVPQCVRAADVPCRATSRGDGTELLLCWMRRPPVP
jgi:hypothetical protein